MGYSQTHRVPIQLSVGKANRRLPSGSFHLYPISLKTNHINSGMMCWWRLFRESLRKCENKRRYVKAEKVACDNAAKHRSFQIVRIYDSGIWCFTVPPVASSLEDKQKCFKCLLTMRNFQSSVKEVPGKLQLV